jgi:hypothetical protein
LSSKRCSQESTGKNDEGEEGAHGSGGTAKSWKRTTLQALIIIITEWRFLWASIGIFFQRLPLCCGSPREPPTINALKFILMIPIGF